MRRIVMTLALVIVPALAGAQEATRDRALQQLRLGQDALRREQYPEAERAFLAAIQLDERLELAHYGLGQTHMATRRYAQAVQTYTKCKDVFQANEADRLSQDLSAEQRLEDQIRSLRDQRRALESGRLRTTNLTASLNQIDNEIHQLETLRRRGERSSTAIPPYIRVALGSAYFRSDAFAEAEREWRSALEGAPRLGEVHNNLAVLYMLTGRLDQADEEVKQAEKAGFRVSEHFKDDLKKRRAGTSQDKR